MTKFSSSLIRWYSHNKRELPWRDTNNPYNIWVSEIILQQTRVKQGLDYYYRFIERFPDVKSLAKAEIDDLLKLWQGLGYYSRARNMYATANYIYEKLDGIFPNTYNELLKLKGIGDYTASAIASIAFGQPTPVLDGNVFRVLARLFGISESTQTSSGKNQFKEKLLELIPQKDPGTFNQALMEFGALQCTPKNPVCSECPFKEMCFANKHNMVNELPLKKSKVKQRIRYFNFLYIIYNDKYTFIEQRKGNDIWKLLYQFPLIETKTETPLEELTQHNEWTQMFQGLNPEIENHFFEKKHILSHQKIHARFYKLKITNLNDVFVNRFIKTEINKLDFYGVPRLIENYLMEINK